MLTRVQLITASGRQDLPFAADVRKITANLPSSSLRRASLAITFTSAIAAVRTHDYRWTPPAKNWVAGPLAPKVLRLETGIFVQPGNPSGYWQASPDRFTLLWHFNPENAAPIVEYGDGNVRKIVDAEAEIPAHVTILFTSDAVEFSRSRIPFSAVACFTDHCDFDTAENLKIQRECFRESGVRVTKGFFLNHFSKRDGNASYERDAAELDLWRADGHELAYHSLSQSIKPEADSFSDFRNFEPPFPGLDVWIDHGYQPYNLTMYRKLIGDADFAGNLGRKDISTLWNYIDSGTAAKDVINQLNPEDFTLARFASGISGGLARRTQVLVKAIMFHHYADDAIVDAYKKTAGSFKQFTRSKKPAALASLCRNLFGAGWPVAKVFAGWPLYAKRTFRLAAYTPVFFIHTIAGRKFQIFQTIEMVDFRNGLSKDNIDRLIAESGLFIAHTYFSVPHAYHAGRMIRNGKVDSVVAGNFMYLGQMAAAGKIWNPTLGELRDHLVAFERISLDVDADGHTVVHAPAGLHYRHV